MKKRLIRVLAGTLTAFIVAAGTVYAGEADDIEEIAIPNPMPDTGSIDTSGLTPEEKRALQSNVIISAEEEEELKKSVSESRAEFDITDEQGFRYENTTDPELKVSYDREEEAFVYRMPDGAYFKMTAPIGSIANEPVRVEAGTDAWIVSLLKNGVSALPEKERYKTVSEALAAIDDEKVLGAELTENGEYLFHIRSTTLSRSKREVNDSYPAIRVNSKDSPLWINEIFPPYGYEMDEAALNGRKIGITDPDRLELTKDGEYEIRFRPVNKELPGWVSVFRRDTTAPYLIFTPALTGETVRTPVSYKPSEEGVKVRVFLNNTQISLYNSTAAANGEYRVIVSDSTGNDEEYEFRIMLEEQAPVRFYLILAGVFIIAALLVIVTAHRRMRII